MRPGPCTKDPNPSPDSETKGAVPNLAPQASNCGEGVTKDRQSSLKKDDSPVSLSDVDKLIAFAESITLSEQKETP
jgi:hypothetical protein